MNYILKLVFFIYIILKLILAANVEYMEVALLLAAAASCIFREKFGSNAIMFILEGLIIYYGITINTAFSFLYGLMVYDLISSKYYLGLIPILAAGIYLLQQQALIDFCFIIGLCCIFAYMKGVLQTKEELYRNSFDKQREYSYQLEQTKARLLNAAEEAAHLAEVKERNRIARQIHDNVGHSIAGILMQLQASGKLLRRDADKASDLLEKSIAALSSTLATMRDTVHNIKPAEKLGVEYLEDILNNFSYCPISFSTLGDIGLLPANIMQLLQYNIKEALTNISRYSKATKVEIKIEVNEKFVRLYIKDNGTGGSAYKEGLGISGMKERVRDMGGTIAISAEDGFLIVCVIPFKNFSEVSV